MKYRLSICIPTLNRGRYIGETMESILSQWQPGVEVVIVDGGSTDETEQVVSAYQKRFPDIRYFKKDFFAKKPSNDGFDRDCDHSIVLAEGKYCWLMTDDDLLKPNALKKVLLETEKEYALIVANAQVMNSDFTKSLVRKRPSILHDLIFKSNEWDYFASTVASHLTFVGAVIIKRHLWLNRSREKYFGSGFIHVGVIFQEPIIGTILVTSDPLVSIRFGNAQWTSRAFQIWMFNWPSLIWSFPCLSAATKSSICPREPWRSLSTLLFNRALGMYSMHEYQNFIQKQQIIKIWRLFYRLIAIVPRGFLYIPVWIYIRTMMIDNTYVLFNLKASWKKK